MQPLHDRIRLDEPDVDENTVRVFTTPCIVCGGTTQFSCLDVKFKHWKAGALIQNVWPDVPASVRETMISGFHPDCWDATFKEDA